MRAAKRTTTLRKINLPLDMLHEILSRLPLKSLCRFMYVSKQWCNHISDPDFVKLYNDKLRKNNPPLLLFYNGDRREIYSNIGVCRCSACLNDEKDYCENYPEQRLTKFETNHYLITTTADSDGRVCGEFQFRYFEGNTGDVTVVPSGHELVFLMIGKGNIYVCNPSTHEEVKLPWPCGISMEEEGCFALTYVPSTGDYKLLHSIDLMSYDHHFMETECQVYDIRKDDRKSGSGSWRRLYSHEKFPDNSPWLLDVVLNIDGGVYWWIKPGSYTYDTDGERLRFQRIIFLDMEKDEDFLILDKPKECSYPFSDSFYLTGLKGQLSLIHKQDHGAVMDIWMLKDPRNSMWAKEYSFIIPIENSWPVHVDERDIIFYVFLDEDSVYGELSKYSMVGKNLVDRGDIPLVASKTGPYFYSEGLFPLVQSSGISRAAADRPFGQDDYSGKKSAKQPSNYNESRGGDKTLGSKRPPAAMEEVHPRYTEWFGQELRAHSDHRKRRSPSYRPYHGSPIDREAIRPRVGIARQFSTPERADTRSSSIQSYEISRAPSGRPPRQDYYSYKTYAKQPSSYLESGSRDYHSGSKLSHYSAMDEVRNRNADRFDPRSSHHSDHENSERSYSQRMAYGSQPGYGESARSSVRNSHGLSNTRTSTVEDRGRKIDRGDAERMPSSQGTDYTSRDHPQSASDRSNYRHRRVNDGNSSSKRGSRQHR